MMLLMTAPKADDGYDVVEFLISKGTLPASMRKTMATIREGMRETEAILPGYLDRLSQSVWMLTRDDGRARAARMLGSGEVRVTFIPQQDEPARVDPPAPAKPTLSAAARKYEREYLANHHLAAVGLSLEDYAQHRAWEDSQAAQREANDPACKPENSRYVDEYRTNPNFAKVGLSLADYIAGRRVDDGLDVLMAVGAARKEAPHNPLIGNGGQYQVGSDSF